MVDYVADVKKYAENVNDAVVAGIVKHFGIAMRENSDSSFVSVSDKAELNRVRDGFCKKKLALTQSDEELDAAIKEVGAVMKDERRKLRSTFCYLLAEKFGKLDMFGG
ncbi:MAG: DUF2853 family protein [Planctomycetota bacterium]